MGSGWGAINVARRMPHVASSCNGSRRTSTAEGAASDKAIEPDPEQNSDSDHVSLKIIKLSISQKQRTPTHSRRQDRFFYESNEWYRSVATEKGGNGGQSTSHL